MKITERVRADLIEVGDVLIIPFPAKEDLHDAFVCLETVTGITDVGMMRHVTTEWSFLEGERQTSEHRFVSLSYVTKL